MDRNYFYQKHAREKQQEFSKELATRSLLREARPNPAKPKQVLRVALRLLPVALAITILILLHAFG